MTTPIQIIVTPDPYLGFLATPEPLTNNYIIITGVAARSADDAAETLRRILEANKIAVAKSWRWK